MKKDEKKKRENIEKLGEVLDEKKKMPKDVKDKLNSKRFENMVFAVITLLYFAALNLGISNIPTENYLVDLRVFSVLLLIISIIIFEVGYKKDNESIWLHGVEIIAIAIFTLYLIYLYSLYYSTVGSLIILAAIVFLIYYAVKMLIIKKRIKNEYKKSLTDIRTIVKK